MPQPKKQHLKKRPDGRYACRYKGMFFYGATEAEALAAREEYKRSEVFRPASRETVAEFGARWLPVAKAGCSRSTYNGWQCHLEHLIADLGDEAVADVTPLQVKTVYSTYYAGLSASYIGKARTLYTALFDAAIADGIRTTNPARDRAAAPHKGTRGGHRAITAQEREWIETLCTGHRVWPSVMAMLYAGLRPQEAKALDIDRSVDFKAGRISVVDFAHLDGDHYKITSTGKTDRAVRKIPLFMPLRRALQGRHGLLITSAAGKQVSRSTWRVAWRSYINDMETAINGCRRRWYGRTREHKAILARGEKLPPWISFTVQPYDLRHSFATWCRDNGVEMHTCIAWMGHADAHMILKVYDEVTDARIAAEAARLEALFGSQNGSQPDSKPPETAV